MEKLLINKRAIVTGGNRGLGLAIANSLAEDGAQVMVVARTEDKCEAAAARIRDRGGVAAHYVSDVSVPENAKKIVDATLEAFGGVDILVNNAGVFVWKKFLELSQDEFQKTLGVNLSAAFFLSQEVAKTMVKQGEGGSIINIASIHGKVGDGNVVPHCTSKFGLIGLTKAMAEALREYGIRANAICPGAIDDDSADRRSSSPREKVTQADISTLTVFLASDLSQSITGSAIDTPGSTRTQIKV